MVTKIDQDLSDEVVKLNAENASLKLQLNEALKSLNAIKTGNIDAIVVGEKNAIKVFAAETSDKTYRILIEKMHEGAVTLTEDGIILYCNSYFAGMVNLSLEKIMGSQVIKFIDDSSKQHFETLLKQGKENAVKKEIYLAASDGKRVPVLMSVNPLSFDSHDVLSIILTDLTIQNEIQEELRLRTTQLENNLHQLQESEEVFRLIVENVKDYSIIFLDAEGNIKSWNKGSERIKGYSANEIIGKHISVVYTEDKRRNKEPERNLQIAKDQGRYKTEGLRVRKDGSLFFADVVLTALYDDKGMLRGFSKITRDITERKKAESDIKQNSDELAQMNVELAFQNVENEKRANELTIANKELTTFTYISSHDLQEPLRKIQNFVSVILHEDEKNLSETGKRYFERMRQTANRMQELIQDLLTYSRTKNSDRKFERTDLRLIIDDIKKDLEDVIHEKKATIEVINGCEINIMTLQFRQLMQNLVSNSLKFARPTIAPHITMKCENANGCDLSDLKLLPNINYCHIVYTDNGIGFSAQYNERIFEVFQRLHSHDEYKGTGIGLAICKRIIENHNGAISASGDLDKGARFDIYLPE